MALPDFKLVGPAIHLALPNYFLKLSTYLNIFINIFIFFKVNDRKINKLNHERLTYGFYIINIGALWILDLGRHLLHIILI